MNDANYIEIKEIQSSLMDLYLETMNVDNDPLIEAVKFQDIPKVKELLALGFNPNTRPSGVGGPVLEISVYFGNIEIVKSLIEAGADVNDTDCEGGSSLMIACFENHLEIVNILLSAGADVNALLYRIK